MAVLEPGESAPQPAPWALERAARELYGEPDTRVITAYAWELMHAAQEIEDERHDEFDDSDEGGEA
jgi:hypothetical protein